MGNRKRRGAAGAVGKCSDALHERIRRVLHTFASNGCVDLVLGAWGCGVFGNDPATVAQLFNQALGEFTCFRRVIFAVLDPKMAKVFGEEFQVPVEGLQQTMVSDERDAIKDDKGYPNATSRSSKETAQTASDPKSSR